MTNDEKYKSAKERAEAFHLFCKSHNGGECKNCPLKEPTLWGCEFRWLDLEAGAEKPLPCPFCGAKVQIIHDKNAVANNARWLVNCYCCPYEYGAETKENLIAAHNRVARAVAKEVAQ